MKEILNELSLNYTGYYDDNKYIVELDNSNQFNYVLNKLNNNSNVEENTYAGVIMLDKSTVTYMYKNYLITLTADLTQDTYTLELCEGEDK